MQARCVALRYVVSEVHSSVPPGDVSWVQPTADERLTLQTYQDNTLWYRTRVSFASKRGDGAGARTHVAAGLRLSLEDQADLRLNRLGLLATLHQAMNRVADLSRLAQ